MPVFTIHLEQVQLLQLLHRVTRGGMINSIQCLRFNVQNLHYVHDLVYSLHKSQYLPSKNLLEKTLNKYHSNYSVF